MAEEQTPKKVVKRVVKRPIAPTTTPPRRPTMRYGRPVDGPATKVAARDEPAAAPPTTPAGPKVKKPQGKSRPSIQRPTVSAPSINLKPVLEAIRSRTSTATTAVSSRTGRAGRATGRVAATGWSALRAWRIPHLEPVRATVITGLLVGLVSVGLGVGALRLFTEVRGVANGGAFWGTLSLVVVIVIAFVLGAQLLDAFGITSPRLTSFLGVVLTLIIILSVFLGLADSRYGLVVVPLTAAAAFWASHRVLSIAASSPADVE